MIIINAHIFQIQDLKKEDIMNDIQKLGIDDFINVPDLNDLNYAIQTNKFQQIILFSNLPPNHFYNLNNFDVSKNEFETVPKFRVNKYYSHSTLFFHNLFHKYQEQIVEAHFITSAKKEVLDDTYFSKIGGGLLTTVQRKREWFGSGFDYDVLLKKYIIDKVYAANNSILTPNRKVLLEELMANYCQN